MNHSQYRREMLKRFAHYRNKYFAGRDHLYDAKHAHVFEPRSSCYNLFSPDLVRLVLSKRHRWFANMGSSQALAVSVFGTMIERGDAALLTKIPDEHGVPLLSGFVPIDDPELEHRVTALNEPMPTQVDLFLRGQRGDVAIECKLWEGSLGPCSQIRKRKRKRPSCDGTYAYQAGRKAGQRCALTEKGIRYWEYIPHLFHWSADRDYCPCPICRPYQLVRNVLAAAADDDTHKANSQSVAILLCDASNPATAPRGRIYKQYQAVQAALWQPSVLKRATWQALAGFLRERGGYDDLIAWLDEKYGIKP